MTAYRAEPGKPDETVVLSYLALRQPLGWRGFLLPAMLPVHSALPGRLPRIAGRGAMKAIRSNTAIRVCLVFGASAQPDFLHDAAAEGRALETLRGAVTRVTGRT